MGCWKTLPTGSWLGLLELLVKVDKGRQGLSLVPLYDNLGTQRARNGFTNAISGGGGNPPPTEKPQQSNLVLCSREFPTLEKGGV